MRACIALLTFGCVLALPSTTQAAEHSCGEIRVAHAFFRVGKRGPVTCGTARTVMRSFMAGKGIKHGGRYAYEQWWALGRWRCGHGAGGGGCTRGDASIEASWVAWECGYKPPEATVPCRR